MQIRLKFKIHFVPNIDEKKIIIIRNVIDSDNEKLKNVQLVLILKELLTKFSTICFL